MQEKRSVSQADALRDGKWGIARPFLKQQEVRMFVGL